MTSKLARIYRRYYAPLYDGPAAMTVNKLFTVYDLVVTHVATVASAVIASLTATTATLTNLVCVTISTSDITASTCNTANLNVSGSFNIADLVVDSIDSDSSALGAATCASLAVSGVTTVGSFTGTTCTCSTMTGVGFTATSNIHSYFIRVYGQKIYSGKYNSYNLDGMQLSYSSTGMGTNSDKTAYYLSPSWNAVGGHAFCSYNNTDGTIVQTFLRMSNDNAISMFTPGLEGSLAVRGSLSATQLSTLADVNADDITCDSIVNSGSYLSTGAVSCGTVGTSGSATFAGAVTCGTSVAVSGPITATSATLSDALTAGAVTGSHFTASTSIEGEGFVAATGSVSSRYTNWPVCKMQLLDPYNNPDWWDDVTSFLILNYRFGDVPPSGNISFVPMPGAGLLRNRIDYSTLRFVFPNNSSNTNPTNYEAEFWKFELQLFVTDGASSALQIHSSVSDAYANTGKVSFEYRSPKGTNGPSGYGDSVSVGNYTRVTIYMNRDSSLAKVGVRFLVLLGY